MSPPSLSQTIAGSLILMFRLVCELLTMGEVVAVYLFVAKMCSHTEGFSDFVLSSRLQITLKFLKEYK